jgi:outer membrane lipoprotein-sorting protein
MKASRVAAIGIALLCMVPLGSVSQARRSPQGKMETKWTLDRVLRQLDVEAREFQSLSAGIERTKVTVVVNDRSTEYGQIYVRRDDKMRIDLTHPDQRTILRNGDHFYIYNPKIQRVEEYDLGRRKSLVDQFLLLGFGTSGSSLEKSYLVTFQGEELLDNYRVLALDLTPKSEDVRQQISKIQLWIDEATWLPVQQKFYETGSGDYFIIRYNKIVRNVRIADSEFKPRWPRGVTVIKPQG